MPFLRRMIDSIGAGPLHAPASANPLYQRHPTSWRTSVVDFRLVESQVKPGCPRAATLRACLEPNPFFACIQSFSRGLSSGMLPGGSVQRHVETHMGSPPGGLIRSRGRASGRGRPCAPGCDGRAKRSGRPVGKWFRKVEVGGFLRAARPPSFASSSAVSSL